jgi:hypothetical protein
MSIWKILKNHCRSSRFVIIMTVVLLTFIAGIITTVFKEFPFAAFAGILNALGLGSYITKTNEPGRKERSQNADVAKRELV